MKKEELILNKLIDLYIKEHTPVSSGLLKKRYELPFSSSTIRNYFQKLDDEGLIIKIHISSGRVPSLEAIKNYWNKNLNFNEIKISSSLEEIAKQFDVFLAIKRKESLFLKEVLNLNDRFIILDFEKDEVVFKYSKELFHFFTQLINYTLEDIKKIVLHLKLDTMLYKKLSLDNYKNFNKEFLYKYYKVFDVDFFTSESIFNTFGKNLSFKDKFLIYKVDAILDGHKNELIVIGDIYNDYNQLFYDLSA